MKARIQNLAGIVQNPVEFLSHEDGVVWLQEYEQFIVDLQELKNATLVILP
jgi:hypothetical protein